MPRTRWTLTALVLFAPALTAQQPTAPVRPTGQQLPVAAPVALDPAKNRLDALLLQWEAKMKGVQGLIAECVRTETDAVTGTTEVFRGQAKFLRPNRAFLEMVKNSNPSIFERTSQLESHLFASPILTVYVLLAPEVLNRLEREPHLQFESPVVGALRKA